jgi:hypothetical protein
MAPADSLEEAIRAVTSLRLVLQKRRRQRTVRSQDERSILKATAIAWFQSQRPQLQTPEIATADGYYRSLLERAEKEATRVRLVGDLAQLKKLLIGLRSHVVATTAQSSGGAVSVTPPPDFSRLVSDPKMKTILENRWNETQLCMSAGAHLAATVMMGGFLEGLLLARLNKMPNMKPAFTSQAAPKDRSGKTFQLKDWTLQNFIEVAHELKWIRRSAKDVGVVIRDYRNYIHPQKEFSHGVSIGSDDTAMFWSVVTALATQVIRSA